MDKNSANIQTPVPSSHGDSPVISYRLSIPDALLVWRLYLILAILQGIVSLSLLLRVGADRVDISNLSPVRLGFVLAAALLLLFLTWLVLKSWRKARYFEYSYERLTASLSHHPQRWSWILLLSGIFALVGIFFITLTPEISEPFTRAYFDRIIPLVIWLTGLSTQTLIALSVLRYGKDIFKKIPRDRSFYLSIAGIGLLFLLWSLVAQKSSAQEAQITVWGAMGAPLLEFQVLIAWLAGMGMLALLIFLPAQTEKSNWLKKITPRGLDVMIGLLLWIASIWIWQSIPLMPNWFVSEPRAPNHEYYPNSDAQYYDITAQSTLIGEGFLYFDEKTYVRRPMLALLTVVLHALGKQDYTAVAFLQILVLAIITPLGYYLTRLIHNRISGVIAAVMIMLREANSIALTSRITTSNAKLLMADVPAMLVVLVLALMISLWLKIAVAALLPGTDPEQQKSRLRQATLYALYAGGILGIGMLVRPEIFMFSAVIAIITAVIYLPRKSFAPWIKTMLVFLLGIGLVLTPWFWRNWKITGQLVLDSPIMRLELIVLRYRSAGPATTPQPEKTPTQNSAATTPLPTEATQAQPEPTAVAPRLNFSYQEFVEYFQDETTEYIRKHPEQILRFVTAHFTHSYIQTLLILPSTFRGFDSLTAYFGHHSLETFWQDCCSSLRYIRRLPYWRKWDGNFPSQATLPLIINCLFIAVGISEAWKRKQWIGITPLLMSTLFYFVHAIFRNSGGRYIVPTDWVSILYFSIGLSHLSLAIFHYLGLKLKGVETWDRVDFTMDEIPAPRRSIKPLLVTAIGLFLIGCLLPAVEFNIPKRYTEAKSSGMLDALYQSAFLDENQRNSLISFVESGGLIYPGRALYPIFYLNADYEPGSRVSYQQTYSRLTFYLVGPKSKVVVLPLSKSPAYFPNASDTIVFLCPDGKILAAAAFDPAGQPATLLWRSDLQNRPETWVCPLPEISADALPSQP